MPNKQLINWYRKLHPQEKLELAKQCKLSITSLYRKVTGRTQMTLEFAFRVVVFSKGEVRIDSMIPDFNYKELEFLCKQTKVKRYAPDLRTDSDL